MIPACMVRSGCWLRSWKNPAGVVDGWPPRGESRACVVPGPVNISSRSADQQFQFSSATARMASSRRPSTCECHDLVGRGFSCSCTLDAAVFPPPSPCMSYLHAPSTTRTADDVDERSSGVLGDQPPPHQAAYLSGTHQSHQVGFARCTQGGLGDSVGTALGEDHMIARQLTPADLDAIAALVVRVPCLGLWLYRLYWLYSSSGYLAILVSPPSASGHCMLQRRVPYIVPRSHSNFPSLRIPLHCH